MTNDLESQSIRILHDGSFIRPGGSSRVARELALTFNAPVTVGHSVNPEFWSEVDAELVFQNSFHHGLSGTLYNKIPKHYSEFRVGQRYRELDFEEDILISTSNMSKWIIPKWYQTHINYCHVPPPHFYSVPKSGFFDWTKSTGLGIIDQHFTTFVDGIIANSDFTRQRIEKHYRKDAPILHPPVRTKNFYNEPPNDPPYFVMICRLVPMKRPELVARALSSENINIKIIGDGPMKEDCEQYSNVEVLSNITDSEVEELVACSVGGIAFAELEHCGITPKEFQAAGKPVVVPNEPNLKNHVTSGRDGVVVPATESGIKDGARYILTHDWQPSEISEIAEKWNRDAFAEQACEIVWEYINRG